MMVPALSQRRRPDADYRVGEPCRAGLKQFGASDFTADRAFARVTLKNPPCGHLVAGQCMHALPCR